MRECTSMPQHSVQLKHCFVHILSCELMPVSFPQKEGRWFLAPGAIEKGAVHAPKAEYFETICARAFARG